MEAAVEDARKAYGSYMTHAELSFGEHAVDVRVADYTGGVNIALYHDDRMLYNTTFHQPFGPQDEAELEDLCGRTIDRFVEEHGIFYLGPLLEDGA